MEDEAIAGYGALRLQGSGLRDYSVTELQCHRDYKVTGLQVTELQGHRVTELQGHRVTELQGYRAHISTISSTAGMHFAPKKHEAARP